MSERDRLLLTYQAEPCGGCMDTYRGDKNHLHHGEVRRGLPEELLCVRENMVVTHDRCHVPESPWLRIYSALILSARMFREQGGGPQTIMEWVRGLPTVVPLAPSHSLQTISLYWQRESKIPCPMCGKPYLHFAHPDILHLPAARVSKKGVVCWRCLWNNLKGVNYG